MHVFDSFHLYKMYKEQISILKRAFYVIVSKLSRMVDIKFFSYLLYIKTCKRYICKEIVYKINEV